MSDRRKYSGLESLVVGGVPAVCTFLYDWRLGVAWLCFALIAGSSR